MHAKSFDRDHDVSWPLHPAPTFVAEADRALGGGSDAREAHLAMLAIEPDRCALEFSERPVKISFIGTATHRVRLALASALSSDDGGDIISRVWQPSSTVLRDDSELLNLTRAMGCNRESGDMATTVMACSQFVLAPRGHSLHSSRLLEAIASGAVPIVVSDGWVLPFEYEDIDWDSIVLRVSEAAVANVTRIARQAATSSFWNDNATRGDGRQLVVPVISLRTILEDLGHVDIPYLKTDMQGADFEAIRAIVEEDSAGVGLFRRIPNLLTEVWMHNEQSYTGFKNDLCRDWLPMMDSIGYRLVYLRMIESEIMRRRSQEQLDQWSREWGYNPHVQCAHDISNPKHIPRPGLFEADAHWIRNDTFEAILNGEKPPRPPLDSDHDWPLFY
ncbi:hypothetical protein CTAYLR_003278 [Chrysophaeum taylorii]|uniref:Uncharacterized protein n=1 Tax=Chrysophaeum taylorii TaxID=2483200 RepID=A0AAD7XK32_9STRA|nr:hypothetical protein CTAYLR_003278 [Chrysophaeum taylorii]